MRKKFPAWVRWHVICKNEVKEEYIVELVSIHYATSRQVLKQEGKPFYSYDAAQKFMADLKAMG